MKLKLFYLSLALVAATALFSCNKSDDPGKLPTPKQATNARSIKPHSNDVKVTINNNTYNLNSIEFLRSGRYALKADVISKAETSGVIVFSGTFTVNGNVYTTSGDIVSTFTLDETNGTLSSPILGTATIEVTFVNGDVPGGSMEDFLYRGWAIESMVIDANNGTIKHLFDDNEFAGNKNISVVVAYLKTKQIDIDVEKYSKYDVKEINFGASNVTVSFTNPSISAFSGQFNVSGSLATANFNYNLSEFISANNPFVNAQASGNVTFPDGKIKLHLSVVTAQLEGAMELVLKPVQ